MPTTPAGLTYSTTPVVTSYDGQIIENLDIWVASGDAIRVEHANVTIRNVIVHHAEGSGIVVDGADNVTVSDSRIVNSDPPTGNEGEDDGGDAFDIHNIRVEDSSGFRADHVTVEGGSVGVLLIDAPEAVLTNLEGLNFQGPFPGGQFVQFSRSPNGSLTDFYTYNDLALSHTEDNISVYDSPDTTISRGVIDGNNSPSGVGIMFEGASEGGRVESVDAIHMGNGAFSSYSDDVSFDRTRSFENLAGDLGRGESLSNTLIFYGEGENVSFTNATYTDPGNPDNIAAGNESSVLDISEAPDATPMGHISNVFDWQTVGDAPTVTLPSSPAAPPVVVAPEPEEPAAPVVDTPTATPPATPTTPTTPVAVAPEPAGPATPVAGSPTTPTPTPVVDDGTPIPAVDWDADQDRNHGTGDWQGAWRADGWDRIRMRLEELIENTDRDRPRWAFAFDREEGETASQASQTCHGGQEQQSLWHW